MTFKLTSTLLSTRKQAKSLSMLTVLNIRKQAKSIHLKITLVQQVHCCHHDNMIPLIAMFSLQVKSLHTWKSSLELQQRKPELSYQCSIVSPTAQTETVLATSRKQAEGEAEPQRQMSLDEKYEQLQQQVCVLI